MTDVDGRMAALYMQGATILPLDLHSGASACTRANWLRALGSGCAGRYSRLID